MGILCVALTAAANAKASALARENPAGVFVGLLPFDVCFSYPATGRFYLFMHNTYLKFLLIPRISL